MRRRLALGGCAAARYGRCAVDRYRRPLVEERHGRIPDAATIFGLEKPQNIDDLV
jgi:hypothetical protein